MPRVIDFVESITLYDKLWDNYNNNNRFTAPCPGLYPGEPVPEETLTHTPS